MWVDRMPQKSSNTPPPNSLSNRAICRGLSLRMSTFSAFRRSSYSETPKCAFMRAFTSGSAL